MQGISNFSESVSPDSHFCLLFAFSLVLMLKPKISSEENIKPKGGEREQKEGERQMDVSEHREVID